MRAGHPAPRAVYEALARELVEAAARSGFAHVTARCDADDREAQRALAEAGFARIETLVTLTHERGRAAPPVFPAEEAQAARVRPATPDDVPALRALAAARFRRNRYHRDDALPRARADALMARWIESYARETDDHEVWVAEDERGELAGFLGHALNRELERRAGVLVSGRALLATRDARDGVGRLLARTHVARSRGDLHEADTQLDNDGMLRVAFGLGMELTRARFTFTRAL